MFCEIALAITVIWMTLLRMMMMMTTIMATNIYGSEYGNGCDHSDFKLWRAGGIYIVNFGAAALREPFQEPVEGPFIEPGSVSMRVTRVYSSRNRVSKYVGRAGHFQPRLQR